MTHSKLHEAMSCMRASDDLYERALAQASGRSRPRRRGHAMPLAAALALMLTCALALGTTAYAVVNSTFFQDAFSSHGRGDRTYIQSESGDGKDVYTYVREYETVDANDISDDMTAAIEPVGLTVKGHGYTLTVESMAVDENGCGIVRYSLSNPNGLHLDTSLGSDGEVVFDYDADEALNLISIQTREGADLNSHAYYDNDTATDTDIQGTMYFTPTNTTIADVDDIIGGIYWSISWAEGDDTVEARSEAFTPTKLVSTRTFASGEHTWAHVSPFSIAIQPDDRLKREFIPDTFVLHRAGKEDLTVKQGDIASYTTTLSLYVATLDEDEGTLFFIPSFLLNTADIESISIQGRTEDEDSPGSHIQLSFELTPVS